MTDTQTLTKAVELAKSQGWNTEVLWDEYYDGFVIPDGDGDYNFISSSEIIFDKDFAKALWGEEEVDSGDDLKKKGIDIINNYRAKSIKKHGWQHHLQQMVVADDPIEYLRAHMEDK